MNRDALREHPPVEEPALSAARHFLADTADAITPDMPATCLPGTLPRAPGSGSSSQRSPGHRAPTAMRRHKQPR